MRFRQIQLYSIPLFLTMACMTSSITSGQSTYQSPPVEIVDIIDIKPEPAISFSPDSNWMLLVDRDSMPDIADVSRRMVALAGNRIDPIANGPFRTDFNRGISLRPRDGRNSIRIPLQDPSRVGTVSWSHDSKSFVYTLVTDNGTELWWAATDNPSKPIRLTDRLNTVLQSFDWMPDGRRVLCCLVPENHGREPASPSAPSGPNIQESYGNTSPTRTYQDLLTNAHDEALFEYFATTQLAILEPSKPDIKVGEPAMIDSVVCSPDGMHLLVTKLLKPFSYLLTSGSFPKQVDVLGLDGRKIYHVVDIPMEENIPIEGVRTGRRSVQWRPGHPATLVWTEALDEGDPRKKVPHRDQLKTIDSPFNDPARDLVRIEHRYAGISFFPNPNLMMTTEMDRDRRWVRSLLHDASSTQSPPKIMVDRSMRDRYGDPGRILTKPDSTGFSVAQQSGPWVWLVGQGATSNGNLPFLDRKNIETLQIERLWRCSSGFLESVVSVLPNMDNIDIDGSHPKIITRRESPSQPPNYFLRDLATATEVALTDFQDPTPQLRGIRKKIVKYQRADGVPLSATLYLPADYVEGTRLPLIVWAYPLEFNDASTAGQISANPSEFTRIGGISHLALLTQGYAIMDEATMPVIGDPETMNDTFVEQIVGAAKAAIDHAVSLGVADGNRVGVGGHSYGAFMTANLLAHCDLFKAGVARSGAYNRTLTPFGFQSERRPIWEAKEIYSNISPFMHADKIKTPILLIHGENDNNPGTFPIQSQRMFQAVKGNGGTTRLVMLPHESHGYRARQSVLHTQAEMVAWFNKYVKGATNVSSR
ncbi:MAG: prolyl oligopeptidase family serine peptidase [Planctomycetota bacterium]|nr:prolyl oligopeptidase family serine peptidase [Planctomycetota bacterium]